MLGIMRCKVVRQKALLLKSSLMWRYNVRKIQTFISCVFFISPSSLLQIFTLTITVFLLRVFK